MTSFNRAAPEDRPAATETIEIGWQHEPTPDGGYTLVRDGDGNPVPRSYTIPAQFTHRDVVDAVDRARSRLDGLDRGDAGLGDVYEFVVEIVGELIGRDTVHEIGTDPTVDVGSFWRFVEHLAGRLGLWALIGGGGGGRPLSR